MTKTLIHPIPVTVSSAKLQFQIPLPRNARRVSSIRVTTDAAPMASKGPVTEAGWLWLRIPEMRDVFFAEIVRVPLQNYGMQSYAPIRELSFMPYTLWVNGTREVPLSLTVNKRATLIEGYYTDQLKGFVRPYTVQIYLQIEV